MRICIERVTENSTKKCSLLDKTLPVDFLATNDQSDTPTVDKTVHVSCAVSSLSVVKVLPYGEGKSISEIF